VKTKKTKAQSTTAVEVVEVQVDKTVVLAV
jgi:hypothetical protein